MAQLRAVGRLYPGPPQVQALHACNLELAQGEMVTITGRSGSGKSTLLNVLGLLDVPTSGTYELCGIDTGKLPERDRTALRGREIGFVFQAFHLINQYTAVANVALAMTYTQKGRRRRFSLAADVLARVGLGHLAATPVGRLSGGERQRVAVARAVACNPSLLLCDEPTGNLDSASAERVLEMIINLNASGTTVLLATHDSTVAALGHRNIRLADGVVVGTALTMRHPAMQDPS